MRVNVVLNTLFLSFKAIASSDPHLYKLIDVSLSRAPSLLNQLQLNYSYFSTEPIFRYFDSVIAESCPSFVKPFIFENITYLKIKNLFYLRNKSDPSYYYYTGSIQHSEFDQFRTLIDPFTLLNTTQVDANDVMTNIWLGAPNVIAALHYDSVNNIFVQVVQQKLIHVMPPRTAPHLYLYGRHHPFSCQSRILYIINDTMSVSKYEYSVLQDINIESTLTPNNVNDMPNEMITPRLLQEGDLITIPAFWFHQTKVIEASFNDEYSPTVESLHDPGISTSLSMWWDSHPLLVMDDVYGLPLPFESSWEVDIMQDSVILFLLLLIQKVHINGNRMARKILRSTISRRNMNEEAVHTDGRCPQLPSIVCSTDYKSNPTSICFDTIEWKPIPPSQIEPNRAIQVLYDPSLFVTLMKNRYIEDWNYFRAISTHQQNHGKEYIPRSIHSFSSSKSSDTHPQCAYSSYIHHPYTPFQGNYSFIPLEILSKFGKYASQISKLLLTEMFQEWKEDKIMETLSNSPHMIEHDDTNETYSTEFDQINNQFMILFIKLGDYIEDIIYQFGANYEINTNLIKLFNPIIMTCDSDAPLKFTHEKDTPPSQAQKSLYSFFLLLDLLINEFQINF